MYMMQAPAKLEVEVTNLAAKAGKGMCYWTMNLWNRISSNKLAKASMGSNFVILFISAHGLLHILY